MPLQRQLAARSPAAKLAARQNATTRLWVHAFWWKRPGSPGSGGASPYQSPLRAGILKRFLDRSAGPGLNIGCERVRKLA
jgi:hypothetical protein